ncbi:MAG: YihY family inner membrane protein [Curvibacter sp.]|jgi:membrane protein|nr:YihY family inner membrane protein [Curvibacter sp.]
MTLSTRLQAFLTDFSRFPWKTTALTLRERFREDRLGLTASSLTFTTTIALVPLLTVALALFTAFPMFAKFQDVLQKWLMESLIPDNIARQVLGYLTQFAGRAGRLGWAGLTVLFFTALSLVFTIDRALNAIWRVRRPRSFGQRLLVYWAAITLGPLLIAASLSITSYLVGASRGSGGALPGGMRLVLDATEFMLIAGGLAAVYHYVPNARVRWSHAWAGAAVGALALEGARNVLTLYLKAVPTYSAVYGAFATVPILLIWIYVAWVIVLLGAVIAAYLPSLLAGVSRRALVPGWRFQLALEVLQALEQQRCAPGHGLTVMQLAARLHVDPLQLEPVAEMLVQLDWVGKLAEEGAGQAPRLVLLAEPYTTLLGPLVQALLLPREASTEPLWHNGKLASLTLRDALSNQ